MFGPECAFRFFECGKVGDDGLKVWELLCLPTVLLTYHGCLEL